MSLIYAGIDLGGTGIKIALGSADGQILQHVTIPTLSQEGPQRILQRMSEAVTQLAKQCDCEISGVGIGVPGLADIKSGVTKFLPNLATQWREVRVADSLRASLGCQVRLLNDVRTASLAELKYGYGKNQPNLTFVFFALGTGVGGGIAIDGKLRLGPLGAAGELGHCTVVPNGRLCGCGNRGCLETVASGPALVAEAVRLVLSGLAPLLHQLVEGDTGRITTKEMAQAAQEGDTHVADVIVQAATSLGTVAANLVTTLHPDMIVLGGGVAGIGKLVTETVQQVIREQVRMVPTDWLRVEVTQLGQEAGVLGAIALAAADDLF